MEGWDEQYDLAKMGPLKPTLWLQCEMNPEITDMKLYFGCLWFDIKIVLFFIISSPSLSQLRLAKQLISDKDSLSVKLCTGMAFNTMQEISNHISKKNTFSLSAQRLPEELILFIPQNLQYETLLRRRGTSHRVRWKSRRRRWWTRLWRFLFLLFSLSLSTHINVF